MNTTHTPLRASSPAAVALIAAMTLCGCAGRTASNMEPKGETVEVAVAAQSVVTADTAAPTDSSLTSQTEQQ